MAKHHSPPQTTLRRYKDGSGWFLEAVGDDGVAENIGDFTSEVEAWDWVEANPRGVRHGAGEQRAGPRKNQIDR